MIHRELNAREKEMLAMINKHMTFQELVDEVRASLPPTRYTRARYFKDMSVTSQ